MSSSDSSSDSLSNLSVYLTSKKFSITKEYGSERGVVSFLRVLSDDTGDDFLLSISNSYSLRSSNDSIEIIPFTDTDRVILKIDGKNSYGEINSEGIEDDTYLDPTDADRMMEQYQAIDLDTERSNILKENISGYKNQLERLKFCTNNIKYKLSVITKSSLCFINRSNSVECFAVKRSSPKIDESKNLCIVIDLETFFENTDSISDDIKRVSKNLHNILGTAHSKQTAAISAKIKQLQTVISPLSDKYNKKEKYQKSIDKLTLVILKIKKQERELQSRMKKINTDNSTSSGISAGSVSNAFKIKNVEDEYTKLMKFKKESVNLLSEIKMEYNNFVLNFDYALFDTLKHFNEISNNLKEIGVIKCKTK